ncbi:MAG: alginate export family protein [Vicinamibacterales bacterium]
MSYSRMWFRLLVVLAIALVHSRPAVAQQRTGDAPAAVAMAPAQTAPPPAVPPLPNRLNTVLPKWLRVRAEYRARMEGFEGAGFTTGRDDLYGLGRIRLNATLIPARLVSIQAQVHDARVAGKQIGPTTAPFRASFDLRQLFVDVGTAKTPLLLRAGRQELTFGEQRLVGSVGWLNAGRSFDAVRLTVRKSPVQLDAFAASVVRILDHEFDKSGNGSRFYGAYATLARLAPRSSVEPYVFWRGDRSQPTEHGPRGDLALTTVGTRWAGTLIGGSDYSLEVVGQVGSVGEDDVTAWASHSQLRAPMWHRLRPFGEYNYASGDKDPTDGTRGTFDQLYPTPHDKYGLADQVGWRNVHHVRGGVELSRLKGWPVTASYHSWWLAQARDGLYAASGALVARVPAGADARHVGQEIDVQVSHALTPQLQLAGGYAHIFAGRFLRQTTPGASYRQPYVMVTYVFLAER